MSRLQHVDGEKKKPAELPEDETSRPFECISMDGFQTVAGEHGLAIVDRHTGFTWCKKTGDMRTGTARVIKNILFEVLGPALWTIDRIKTDHAPNLMGGVLQELCEQLKIRQDASSAYHPSGNRLAENAVKRIKNAMGNKRIEDALPDICALNHGVSYCDNRLSAFEALYGIAFPVNGIPMTDKSEKELVSREFIGDKVNGKANTPPTNPDNNKTIGEDSHPQTHWDNLVSKTWVDGAGESLLVRKLISNT